MMRLKVKGLLVYRRINRHVMLARDGHAVPRPRTYDPVVVVVAAAVHGHHQTGGIASPFVLI
ncbi:hypothetical protein AWB85_21310 [Mycobacteroides immunogenum]|uniref:Uncharacterized protein n=1 Tax=Mycobacteroides immunogenum TaxID=83262 RepID=A0A179VGB5_9MYCO|nr:hypothetical protein AWB85_21310 [Mycobacteroides immunogenum]